MPLPIAARATRCLPAFAILQLIGDVLIAWNVSHKPLTLPQIKELLNDGDDINILPLMHELYMKMWLKSLKYCSFFSPFHPKSMAVYNIFLMSKKFSRRLYGQLRQCCCLSCLACLAPAHKGHLFMCQEWN